MVAVNSPKRIRTCPKCKAQFETEACFLGDQEKFADTPGLCNKCADHYDLEQRERKVRAGELQSQRRWEQICPLGFRNTDPARLPDIAAKNDVLSWQYSGTGLLCHGPTGRGKTRCLYLLLHRLHFGEQRSIIAIGATYFAHECGRRFSENQAEADAYINDLTRVDVLMLDDLDKARFTERTEAELFHVIDARTAQGRPILASVNATGSELAEMMTDHRGWPIVRRLREYCQPVGFGEPEKDPTA